MAFGGDGRFPRSPQEGMLRDRVEKISRAHPQGSLPGQVMVSLVPGNFKHRDHNSRAPAASSSCQSHCFDSPTPRQQIISSGNVSRYSSRK